MAVSKREEVKDALAVLIKGLTDFQTVYGSVQDDLGGETPVAILLSSGSDRKRLTGQGLTSTFYYDLNMYVLYSSPEDDWTPEKAEDRMDDLESQVAAMIVDTSRATPNWGSIAYVGRSNMVTIIVKGKAYLREVIPLAVEVFA